MMQRFDTRNSKRYTMKGMLSSMKKRLLSFLFIANTGEMQKNYRKTKHRHIFFKEWQQFDDFLSWQHSINNINKLQKPI
jgi:hypothetical protein